MVTGCPLIWLDSCGNRLSSHLAGQLWKQVVLSSGRTAVVIGCPLIWLDSCGNRLSSHLHCCLTHLPSDAGNGNVDPSENCVWFEFQGGDYFRFK